MLIFVFAEIVRYGLAAYIWKVCRDKLLLITWVAKLHNWVLIVHHWAQGQIAPVKEWF